MGNFSRIWKIWIKKKNGAARLDPWEIFVYYFQNSRSILLSWVNYSSSRQKKSNLQYHHKVLFNFLSFPFSNFGFLILFWLPSGTPPCPRAYGRREWRGALGVLKIPSGFGGSWRRSPPKKPESPIHIPFYYQDTWRTKKLDTIHHPPPKYEISSNLK